MANMCNHQYFQDSEEQTLSTRYEKINQLLRMNWISFQEEYFSTLRKMNKWFANDFKLKKDDLVLVLHEKLTGRNALKRGRIVKLDYWFEGSKKLISKIQVQIAPTGSVTFRDLRNVFSLTCESNLLDSQYKPCFGIKASWNPNITSSWRHQDCCGRHRKIFDCHRPDWRLWIGQNYQMFATCSGLEDIHNPTSRMNSNCLSLVLFLLLGVLK